MQRPESVIACVNCGATISEAYSEVAGWRYSSDGVGELQSFCELCSAREFAPDAPASALSFYLASYYCGEAPLWRLDCGHEIPLLEHERPDDPPRRQRLCRICQRLRNVSVEP